jgi:glucosamine 6-phosphate synthetase-like amidotransferase/phosphosugar isomerase protein
LADAISSCVSILEGAYSFVLISVLEPEAMYIVKNTGTMVIGVAKELEMTVKSNVSQLKSLDSRLINPEL